MNVNFEKFTDYIKQQIWKLGKVNKNWIDTISRYYSTKHVRKNFADEIAP